MMANPNAFAQQYGQLADKVGGEIGVDPAILLGQWGLETGWGKSVIPGTNNLGNIKDFSGKGAMATDNMTGSRDAYRQYDTPDAFAQDFASLIGRRYQGAIGAGSNAEKYASELKAAGYAEDPDYVRKLTAAAETVRKSTGISGMLDRAAASIFPSAEASTVFPTGGAQRAVKPWKEVMASPQFQGLAPEQQQAAQQEYFDQVVSPRAPKDQLSTVRQQFFQAYPLNSQTGVSTPVAPSQQDPTSMLGQQYAMRAPAQPLSGGNVFNGIDRSAPPAGTGQYSTDIPAPATVPAMPIKQQDGAPALNGKPPQPPRQRGMVEDFARQLGLTARYGLEGVGQAAQLVTEPIRGLINPVARAVGLPEAATTGNTMTSFADTLGLPSPESRQERVVGDAARLMAGGAGGLGVARMGAALPGMVGEVGGLLSAAPTAQVASAAGAGLLGGAARENGSGDLGQAGAALLGGVGAGGAVGLAQGVTNAGRRAVNSLLPMDLELRFNRVLSDAGLDASTLPERVTRSLRAEMDSALRSGRELRPDAVRRLADFRTVGATPTRGMITQDPVQITREQNLAKIAANTSDNQLAALPRIQNQNNATLINNLNEAGAGNALDPYATGERVIGSVERSLAGQKGNIDTLYSAARDTTGRSVPLDGAAFTVRANDALDQALLGGALPADVRNHLNRIAKGEVPFDVNYAEQLKTAMGNLQRNSSDGQTRMALGVVRNALEDTPILPGAATNLGEESIGAFNQARAANRQMMGRVEASPAVKAVYEGTAQPDQYVQKFIVGSGASVRDVRNLRAELGDDMEAVNAVRGNMLDWLKTRAVNGAADETAKFSQSAFNKALGSIGTRKLEQFFNADEIASLRALGRVSSYMQAQPVGSAVNNSNSGALLAGRGYDMLKAVAGKIPFGESAILNPLRNIDVSLSQRRALNVAPGLLNTTARPSVSAGSQYLLPGAAMGGLLAAPSGNSR